MAYFSCIAYGETLNEKDKEIIEQIQNSILNLWQDLFLLNDFLYNFIEIFDNRRYIRSFLKSCFYLFHYICVSLGYSIVIFIIIILIFNSRDD